MFCLSSNSELLSKLSIIQIRLFFKFKFKRCIWEYFYIRFWFSKISSNNNDKKIPNYIEMNCNSEFHNSSVAYYGHMFRLSKIKNYQDLKVLFFIF